MSFYGNLQSTATSLLTQFGAATTLRRRSGDSIDPITGAYTAGTNNDYTVNAVFVRITQRISEAFGDIQANDRVMVMDASQTPTESDTVVIGGEEWGIVQIIENKPADVVISYEVLLRK